MSSCFAKLVIPGLCAVALSGCGDAQEPSSEDPAQNGTAGTNSGGSDTGGSSSGGSSSGGSSSGGSSSGGSSSGGSSSGGSGSTACEAWDVTYDLDGSRFDIRDMPVVNPNFQNNDIGPGTLTLRFPNDGGEPGAGTTLMTSYDMRMDFVVDSGFTKVTTSLHNVAGPADCGVAEGPFDTKLSWNGPRGIRDVHSVGTITCEGGACGLAGLPPREDVDDTDDQVLNAFGFTNGVSNFTMPEIENPGDDQARTFLILVGTETGRELKEVPDCFCQ